MYPKYQAFTDAHAQVRNLLDELGAAKSAAKRGALIREIREVLQEVTCYCGGRD